ncbi:FAD-binding oxidoreductase [Jatrophihabitans sp.]|uniref:FAD-binding oxidoreductase n=1 Tax=Jatrophihabitans sp. TaxID=1932789 RepID=UPI0030C65B9B|nr:Alkyldihydroxyacetonephosphate synthase [Jatrophihabitans sp.]
MTESALPVFDMHPYLWGNPQTPGELPAAAGELLSALGAVAPPAAVDIADAVLPASTLPAAALDALVAAVGADHVRFDHDARVRHTGGFSTPDLIKLRTGDGSAAPDAVVFPADHDEVLAVLAACSVHHVAVVPFSGGTSVVGGLTAARGGFTGVIALDPRRLDRLVSLDEVSRTAVLQPGLRGVRAEALLDERGYTLGHFPQSYEAATIGGYAAARSAGQSSAGYGRFDEMVETLTLATPRGTLTLGTAPKSGAGPDLRQLVLGSEGAFGVITSVTVRVHPKPVSRIFEGWRFEDFAAGSAAMRALVQDGPLPTVVRLSDEAETSVNLADPTAAGSAGTGGCLMITGYEGTPAQTAVLRAGATELLLAHGAESLGEGPGEKWRTGRYRGPYLRDQLLDVGGLVETLETATYWSNIERLKAAVTEALQASLGANGNQSLVLCHISHVYAAGASLYFTVLTTADPDPVAQWGAAKAAANAAIRSCGATISHHHGVGTDHRDTYAEEIGPLGVGILRAVKAELDPEGIMNPGVLVAPGLVA